MTPADLAELLKTAAAAVLAAHGLDTAALPETRGRAPAQPRARRLRHQPGPSGRQEGGRQPPRTGRLAGAALTAAAGIAAAEVAGPGFVNLRIEASAQAVVVENVLVAGADYGTPPSSRAQHQPRVRVGEPDRADPHRRHPLGRRRRRARPAALHPGRPGGPGVLLQRPRRPDRPVHQLADRRRQGGADPEDGYAGDYIADIASQVLAEAPDALSLPASSNEKRSARSAST